MEKHRCLDSIARRKKQFALRVVQKKHSEILAWLSSFDKWSRPERTRALEHLLTRCDRTQTRRIANLIAPKLQIDFVSRLPHTLSRCILSYLDAATLAQARLVSKTWCQLAEDEHLWREKCEEDGVQNNSDSFRLSYAARKNLEVNWRSGRFYKISGLRGHEDHVITCLQVCGDRVVSGSDDNTLKVWCMKSGQPLVTLTGHSGGVWCCEMDYNRVISGSTDRTLRVWSLPFGTCEHTLTGHVSTVRCIALRGNRVVSGSRDATLRVWDVEKGTCLHVLHGHQAAVRCVVFDGWTVVSGSYDHSVRVWKPFTLNLTVHVLRGHTNRVYALQCDGARAVSGSLDTCIIVWDIKHLCALHRLTGHRSLTSGMVLHGDLLISGNADATLRVWNLLTGKCLHILAGPNRHRSAVTGLQLVGSELVVSASDDGSVKLWSMKTGRFIRDLVSLQSSGVGGVVWRIQCNSDRLICAVGSRNGIEETKLLVLDFDITSFPQQTTFDNVVSPQFDI